MSPDGPVLLQVVDAHDAGHVRILVGGHVYVPVLERERVNGIPVLKDRRRQVIHPESVFVSFLLYVLVDKPYHRALVARIQGAGGAVAFDGIIAAEIVTDMHADVNVPFLGHGNENLGLAPVLEMPGQIFGHLVSGPPPCRALFGNTPQVGTARRLTA